MKVPYPDRLRRVASACVFALGAAVLPSAAATEPARSEAESVIYPRNAPQAGRSAVGRSDDGFPMWGSFAVIALLAAGGFYMLKRGGLTRRESSAGAQRLAIEETRPLGNKQFLAVAAYGEKRFLLSVCAGRIDLLSRLDDGQAMGKAEVLKAEVLKAEG